MGLLPLVLLGAMRFVNSDDHSRSLIPRPDASLALARCGYLFLTVNKFSGFFVVVENRPEIMEHSAISSSGRLELQRISKCLKANLQMVVPNQRRIITSEYDGRITQWRPSNEPRVSLKQIQPKSW